MQQNMCEMESFVFVDGSLLMLLREEFKFLSQISLLVLGGKQCGGALLCAAF